MDCPTGFIFDHSSPGELVEDFSTLSMSRADSPIEATKAWGLIRRF